MVFGWGKKKAAPGPADMEEQQELEIGLGEIGGILEEVRTAREAALVSEVRQLRDRMSPLLSELGSIADGLDGDSLDVEEIDKHLRTIIERGKKHVIPIIRAETAPLPEVSTVQDAEALGVRSVRSLKRIEDALGRQSKVINQFAKKYAGRLKTVLADLEVHRSSMQGLLDVYGRVRGGIATINGGLGEINGAAASLERDARRITELEGSLVELEAEAARASAAIDKARGSEAYAASLEIQKELGRLSPERAALSRETSDQFTKISRPLGKYGYVSALDKPGRELLKELTERPFEAISESNMEGIKEILGSVRKGVLGGSVSVKDPDKSVQSIDEITGMLGGLVHKKAEFLSKEGDLKGRLAGLDLGGLRTAEADLGKASASLEDARAKVERLRSEMSETARRLPGMVMDVEAALRRISPVRYRLRMPENP